MAPIFSEKSMAHNDSLLIRPAQARLRVGATALTGLLILALALPAPSASQPGSAGHSARAAATTTLNESGIAPAPSPTLPPGIETGCCA